MKRSFSIILCGFLLLGILSCAGFPKPRGESDSLIIGNLMLDFPDGFFNKGKALVRSGIVIVVVNDTTKEKQSLITSDGYFRFSTNGVDEYRVESFEYTEKDMNREYGIGPVPLKIRISGQGGKIIYLSHMLVTYQRPKAGAYKSGKDSRLSSSWDYEVKLDSSWRDEEAAKYIQEKDGDNAWADYPMVRMQYE